MSRNAHASNKNVKEFSFKGSKEEFDKAGGDLMKMKSVGSSKTLKEMFGGGAEKLSKTPTGMWQTITGNIQSGLQDAGFKILESLKPALRKLIPVSERLGLAIAGFGDKVIEVGIAMGTYFKPIVNSIGSALKTLWEKSEPLREVLGDLGEIVLPLLSEIFTEAVIPAITTLGMVVLPALTGFIKSYVIPVMQILAKWIKEDLIPAIKSVYEWMQKYLVPAIESAWKWFSEKLVPAVKSAYEWLDSFAKKVQDAVGAIGRFIGGIGDAIGGFFGGIAEPSHGSYTPSAGQFATGLQRVPHDGFIAELHKNEAVVPAVSNPYNQGNRLPAMGGMVKLAGVPAGGGTTNNNYNTFNITVTGNETDDQIDVMITKLKRKLANM